MTNADDGGTTGIRDGRIRRGARNRAAIVDALYALIGEGELRPTAEQVAARAGVQVRTVFRHFADMAGLNAEITIRLRHELEPVIRATVREGSPEDRVRDMVSKRASAYERMAPYKRAGDVQRWRHEDLQEEHERFVRDMRRNLIDVLPDLKDDSLRLASLEMVLSFEAWDRLRADQRLGADRARAAMEYAALAILAVR